MNATGVSKKMPSTHGVREALATPDSGEPKRKLDVSAVRSMAIKEKEKLEGSG